MDTSSFDRVSYNKSDVERDAAQEVLADGAIVKFVIDKVDYKEKPTNGKGPGEDIVQMATAYVLDPRDGQTRMKRFRLFLNNTLPLKHPDYVETHEPPEWANGMWAQFLQGVVPERHKPEPERRDGQVFFDGKKVDGSKVAEINMERSDKRLQEAVELVKSRGKDLLRRTAYATIKHSAGKGDREGQLFVNLNDIRPALRAAKGDKKAEALTDFKALVTKVIPGQQKDGEAGSSNGSSGAASSTESATAKRRRRN